MRLCTKHFYFYSGRDLRWDYPPSWWRRCLYIGFGELHSGYRYVLECHYQLLPNFIWWQELIDQGGPIWVHTRIAGIQSWPFYLGLQRH